jgi:hypothetical protein
MVAKISETIAQALSEQISAKVAIEGGATPILEGNLLRPVPTAFSSSSATVGPQYILHALLNDPAVSKKIWQSVEGLSAIVSVGSLIVSLYAVHLQQESLDLQKQSAAFEKAKTERVWIDPKAQPQPSPDPTPDKHYSGD